MCPCVEKQTSDDGKNENVNRLWFTWEGTYTSGKIYYVCQRYLTDVTLKPAAATRYYENHGEQRGKPHDWVIGSYKDGCLRVGRPLSLVRSLRKNCITKEKMLERMGDMEDSYQCRVPSSVKEASTDSTSTSTTIPEIAGMTNIATTSTT